MNAAHTSGITAAQLWPPARSDDASTEKGLHELCLLVWSFPFFLGLISPTKLKQVSAAKSGPIIVQNCLHLANSNEISRFQFRTVASDCAIPQWTFFWNFKLKNKEFKHFQPFSNIFKHFQTVVF